MKLIKFFILFVFFIFLWQTSPPIATGEVYNQIGGGKPLDIFLIIDYSKSIVAKFEKDIVKAIFDEIVPSGGRISDDRLHIALFADEISEVSERLRGYPPDLKDGLCTKITNILSMKRTIESFTDRLRFIDREKTNFIYLLDSHKFF